VRRDAPAGTLYIARMLILLSPAKNLDWSPPPADLPRTEPLLAKDAKALAAAARKLTRSDLSRLMDISDALADLTYARFKAFAKAAPEDAKQAVLAFNGDVYQGLQARTLQPADLAWAQDHLRILSGLYGILRPLDAIQPYRLEMSSKLANRRGDDLYAWWGDRIAKALRGDLGPDRLVLNLASDEYFSAVSQKALGARVVTPKFLDVKNGKARPVFLFVKRARGLMARWAIETRAIDLETLQRFSGGGYRFEPAASTENEWIFTRPQPEAVK